MSIVVERNTISFRYDGIDDGASSTLLPAPSGATAVPGAFGTATTLAPGGADAWSAVEAEEPFHLLLLLSSGNASTDADASRR
jgi:hypothetical protein